MNINENPEIHAGPPCKWLALRKRFESHQDENGPNDHKWNFGHGDGPWSWGGKPWVFIFYIIIPYRSIKVNQD